MKKQYWYMTAYAGLFILIPILNRAIVNLSGRELLKICIAIFVVFSLIPTLLNETVFGLGGGYSAIWLLLLYICGGFWGKYHEICLTHLPDFCFRHRLFLPFLFYLLFTTISFLLKMFGFSQYVSYTSPTILLGSCALFFLFSLMPCSKKSSRVASFLAPSALSVYLIHVHPLIWNHMMLYFAIGHFPSGPMLFVWVITAALCIYLLCTIIDLPRRLLFYIATRFFTNPN